MIRTVYGEGRYTVHLDAHTTNGAGLSVFVYGGDLAHLGGVALASPGVTLHGSRLSNCDMWTMTVPGHKDAELAQRLAKQLCVATGEPVCVSLGLHIDNATKDDIHTLCETAAIAAARFLEDYGWAKRKDQHG